MSGLGDFSWVMVSKRDGVHSGVTPKNGYQHHMVLESIPSRHSTNEAIRQHRFPEILGHTYYVGKAADIVHDKGNHLDSKAHAYEGVMDGTEMIASFELLIDRYVAIRCHLEAIHISLFSSVHGGSVSLAA